MNLHEYQCKNLIKKFKIKVKKSYLIKKHKDVKKIIKKNIFKKGKWILKIQIHAGGRGKAGGIQIIKNNKHLIYLTNKFLGKKFITNQTNNEGKIVHAVLIEKKINIKKELYISFIIDYYINSIKLIISKHGGIEIEQFTKKNEIYTTNINILLGIQQYQLREINHYLQIKNINIIKTLNKNIQNIYKMFIKLDIQLIEINPLIIDKKENIFCADCKIIINNNALYRQKQLIKLYDKTQENKYEHEAKKYKLNYVSLSGNIAYIVNGAGLAMATMDEIQSQKLKPANFLDIGGKINKNNLLQAFIIINKIKFIKGILINIFGGIVPCNLIAQTIIYAIKKINIKYQILVILKGNNSKIANKILKKSKIKNIVLIKNLTNIHKIIKNTKVENEHIN